MILRALRADVYCDAFVVARYEYGVSSQPASGVALSAAPSSPRSSYRDVIFQRKKSVSGRTPVVEYALSVSNLGASSSIASANASLPAARSSTGGPPHSGVARKNVYARYCPLTALASTPAMGLRTELGGIAPTKPDA